MTRKRNPSGDGSGHETWEIAHDVHVVHTKSAKTKRMCGKPGK